MPLTIEDDVLRRVGLTASELRLEVAVMLFQTERLTLAQAASVAELTRVEFQRELAKRSISIHYDPEDFEEDLQSLSETGFL